MNKISGFVFLLASMSLLESIALADNYTITGKIKEYRSLKPISNAKVSFVYDGGGEISAISDEKGNYTIKPELNKSGNLVVSAENYKEYKIGYSAVSNNRDYRINNIDLEFDYFTINGHVFDFVTLDPVKDAEVTLVFEYGEGQSATVKTDEAGRYVIPVLSGHIGGANELACTIAAAIGAEPVLTTATDVSGAFSADLFARENGLRIVNREGIAKAASSSLAGKPVTICIKDYPPQEHVSVLITDDSDSDSLNQWKSVSDIVLSPRKYAVGIGCRRGKSFPEIKEFAEEIISEHNIDPADIGAIATIDIKKDEPGLIRLSEYWRVPLITFDASLLSGMKGDFESSERVREAVGVDNVCERSAAAAAGVNYKLVVKKTVRSGITIAVAARER